MKPSRTPSPTRLRGAAAVALLARFGCVTRGEYDRVVAQRERLAEERKQLTERVEQLQTSNESLEEERLELLGQIEDLRDRRSDLERDVAALSRKHDELSDELTERERQIADRDRQLRERDDALAARAVELEALRMSYEGLVADLQSEVEAGRVRIERMKSGFSMALPSEVLFEAGSAVVTGSGRETIRGLASRLDRVGDRIEVHGHTDAIPIHGALAEQFPTNWELAGARAASVARVLIDAGLDPKRVVAVSHGSQDPVVPNDTPTNRARNRRIEIRLVPLADVAPVAAPR